MNASDPDVVLKLLVSAMTDQALADTREVCAGHHQPHVVRALDVEIEWRSNLYRGAVAGPLPPPAS